MEEEYDDIDDTTLNFYSVTNIDEYCQEIRLLVGNDFRENTTNEELDEYISVGQVEKFVDEFCEDYGDDGSPIISEQSHDNICQAVFTRIQNVGLAKLAVDGHINVAFDEELNDFVFWAT